MRLYPGRMLEMASGIEIFPASVTADGVAGFTVLESGAERRIGGPVGTTFDLGGRRWHVTAVDTTNKSFTLEPVE